MQMCLRLYKGDSQEVFTDVINNGSIWNKDNYWWDDFEENNHKREMTPNAIAYQFTTLQLHILEFLHPK